MANRRRDVASCVRQPLLRRDEGYGVGAICYRSRQHPRHASAVNLFVSCRAAVMRWERVRLHVDRVCRSTRRHGYAQGWNGALCVRVRSNLHVRRPGRNPNALPPGCFREVRGEVVCLSTRGRRHPDFAPRLRRAIFPAVPPCCRCFLCWVGKLCGGWQEKGPVRRSTRSHLSS